MGNPNVGINQRSKDYIKIRVNGKIVFEHRYVWEKANGPIPKDYIIHHIDEDKKNNRIENLKMMHWTEHKPKSHKHLQNIKFVTTV